MMQEPSSPNPNPILQPLQGSPAAGETTAVGKCQAALIEFCHDGDVSWCALIGERGRLITSASPKGFTPRHPDELAAMTADLLRSAQALASRLGEREFRGFFQTGERWHYFLHPIAPNVHLLSVFESNVLPAAVRSAMDTHSERIALAL